MAETKENDLHLDVKKAEGSELKATTLARNVQILQEHGGNHLTAEEPERNKSDADAGTLHSPAPGRQCNEKVLELSSEIFAPEQIAIRKKFLKIIMHYEHDIPHDLKIAAEDFMNDHENLAVELFNSKQTSAIWEDFCYKEFSKLNEKYIDVCVTKKSLEAEIEQLQSELRLEKNILVSRFYIDYFEWKYFPSWLIVEDICRMWKWKIALECQVSEEFYVLTERIRSTPFDIDSVTQAIVKMYGNVSKEEAHPDKDLSDLNTEELSDLKTEEEWNTLLEKLGVDTKDDKKMLRMILEPVTRAHKRYHESAHHLQSKEDNYIFILHFKSNVTLDHDQIRLKFGKYHDRIENTLLFPEKSTKPRLAYLNLNSITLITRDDVIKILETDNDISQVQAKPLLEKE